MTTAAPRYSDEELLKLINNPADRSGTKRAAGYLMELPEVLRAKASLEGRRQSNMTGVRYADGVYAVVADYKRTGEVR